MTSVRYHLDKLREIGMAPPLHFRMQLPQKQADDPSGIHIVLLDERYVPLRFIVSVPRLLVLDKDTLVTFASHRQDLQDAFLRLNRFGELQIERKFRREYEVCDYEKVDSGSKTIAVVGREKLREGQRQYRFYVTLLGAEDGSIFKEDRFPNTGTVYHNNINMNADRKMRSIETTMSPKILSLEDGSFLCLICLLHSKEDNTTKASILARRYTHQLDLIWEKTIYEFDIGPDEMSSLFMNTFETLLIDESRFLLAINSGDRLRFLTFDFDGKQMASAHSPQKKNLIGLHGLFPFNNKSVVAVTAEMEIPEALSEIKKMPIVKKIYTIEP